MFKKVILAVSLVVVLSMALASTGCASGSGFTSMMAKVPADTQSFKYVNTKALRNDADLYDLYDAWKTDAKEGLEVIGISPGDVNVFAHGSSTDKRFTLLVGKFVLDDVRLELDDLEYKKDEYKGVEVWEREVGWGSVLESWVALMDDLIIMGNEEGVRGCISVMKSGAASWLSKSDVNDVANRLPGGVYVELQEQELAGLFIDGLEVTGISAKRLDSGTLKISGVAKFDGEHDAQNALDTIESLMKLRQFKSVDISQESAFLEAKAEMDIDDADSLF